MDSSEKKTTPSLCLNMIVKNESKVITRLFDSVVSIVDYYCICDTGSTDDTKEIITEYFKGKNIPGIIVEEPFKDFAYSRNFALNSCKDAPTDYILLVDADMILEIGADFNKSCLTKDMYTLYQGNRDFYYKNVRIVKNNGSFKYVGVTHEYVSYPDGTVQATMDIDSLFINDIGDGGAKHDKFERDIRLLKKGIEEEPQNKDRYHFYLANSYYSIGDWENAIDVYKKRIEIGGWVQETWQCYYKIGHCYKNLNKMEDAVFQWLEAYNVLPTRVENLYEIVYYYRNKGKNHIAYGFYKIAKDILAKLKDSEKNDHLFLENDKYTYRFDYELSIIAGYVGIFNVNNSFVSTYNHSSDQGFIDNALSNMKYYKDIYKPIAKIDVSMSSYMQVANKYRRFVSSSSCLIPNGDGYLMNMRFVNYTIDSQGCYHDCDDYIITVNNAIEFTKNFKIVNNKTIEPRFDDRRYIGIEDVKIFKSKNHITKEDDIHFIGTTLHEAGNIGISIGYYDTNKKYLEPIEIKTDFNKEGCEKNWIYYEMDNELFVLYKWHPLHICKINRETNILSLVKKDETMPGFFKRVRGSSCGFHYKDEIWFLVHIVSYESPRHYYHSIVVFDKNMKLNRFTAPFKFEGECIEYSLSITVEDNRIIIPYSTWDRTTTIAIYEKSYIESKLIYKP